MTLIFLPRYPEPHNVLTNPHWYLYVKGSSHEDQAPQTSNSIESREPSPCTSGAPLPSLLECSSLSSLSSFRPKHRGPRSLQYMVVVAPQTWLMWSRKTLAHLVQLQWLAQETKGFVRFLTSLTTTRNKPRASANAF
jgi:hypothetical protein